MAFSVYMPHYPAHHGGTYDIIRNYLILHQSTYLTTYVAFASCKNSNKTSGVKSNQLIIMHLFKISIFTLEGVEVLAISQIFDPAVIFH